LRRFELRRLTLASALLLAVFAAACGDDDSSTVTPTPPVQISEAFSGTVTVNGAFSHSFVAERAGQVTAQLTALAPDDTVTIGVALGTWNGSACQLIITNDAAKLASVTIGTATGPGSLCVRLSDVGQLTAATTYEVRVDHY
jgi:hypothetical protein